jgi:hypothetical protein
MVLAGACGSSGSGSGSAAATGQARVDRMVLANGDLPGYHVQSTGAEVLADQLPPAGSPRAALVKRLVTANWVASDHSTLVSAIKGAPIVFSDANLFRSPAAMRRIWALEGAPLPGDGSHDLAPPAGTPAGTRYEYVKTTTRAFYQLSWPEGPVFGILIAFVPLHAHPSALAQAGIAATLTQAAKAESIRIAGAANRSSATI